MREMSLLQMLTWLLSGMAMSVVLVTGWTWLRPLPQREPEPVANYEPAPPIPRPAARPALLMSATTRTPAPALPAVHTAVAAKSAPIATPDPAQGEDVTRGTGTLTEPLVVAQAQGTALPDVPGLAALLPGGDGSAPLAQPGAVAEAPERAVPTAGVRRPQARPNLSTAGDAGSVALARLSLPTMAAAEEHADHAHDAAEPVLSTAAPLAPCVATLQQVASRARVYFDAGSATVPLQARGTIAEVARMARNCPQAQVTLLGFTDPSGDAQSNLQISWKRARTVRDLLVAQGVPSQRIKAQSHMENHGENCEHFDVVDRRVEFEVQ